SVIHASRRCSTVAIIGVFRATSLIRYAPAMFCQLRACWRCSYPHVSGSRMSLISAAIPMIVSAVSISGLKIRIRCRQAPRNEHFRCQTRSAQVAMNSRAPPRRGLSADGQARNTGQGDREIGQALTERGERSAAQAADDLSEPAGLVPGEIDERERGAVGADPQDERDDVERRAVVGRREEALD